MPQNTQDSDQVNNCRPMALNLSIYFIAILISAFIVNFIFNYSSGWRVSNPVKYLWVFLPYIFGAISIYRFLYSKEKSLWPAYFLLIYTVLKPLSVFNYYYKTYVTVAGMRLDELIDSMSFFVLANASLAILAVVTIILLNKNKSIQYLRVGRNESVLSLLKTFVATFMWVFFSGW